MKKEICSTRPVTIAFFKAPSTKGMELFSLFKQRIESSTLRGNAVQVLEQNEYTMMAAILACFNCDVVVFDGSIEDMQNEQYYAAIELMKALDYVLIVSRTVLPFNFEGTRKGGAPTLVSMGTDKCPGVMTNENILSWLLNVLEYSDMDIPRHSKVHVSEAELRADPDQSKALLMRMLDSSIVKSEEPRGVFVSYLSHYSRLYEGPHSGYPCVEDLFEVIQKTSRVRKEDILYFPPGKVSLELMTEQRRFEITYLTERYIIGCREIWIYETPDYHLSWWTFGELLALSRSFLNTLERCPDIYVAVPYKMNNGQWAFKIKSYLTPMEKKRILPPLTASQKMELASVFVNSDPEHVGYEQVEKMRTLAQLPTPLLRLHVQSQKEYLKHQIQQIAINFGEEYNNVGDSLSTDEIIRSIRSYAYTHKFWENRVIDCPICRAELQSPMTLDKYLQFKAKHFHSVSQAEYRKICDALEKNERVQITLPCGHRVSLKKIRSVITVGGR